MAAVSKHAAMVFGLSLFASTASAAIPDANGVIHGCYNQLTGSTRIIDGNRCGLLEKEITWAQTGPRGPAGAAGASVTGQSLPVGDANCPAGGVALTLSGTTSYVCNGRDATDTMYLGWDTLDIGAVPANSERIFYISSRPFMESKPGGVCVYNYAARFHNPVPGVVLTPQLRINDNGRVGMNFARTFFPDTGGDDVATATTAGWNLRQNEAYTPGIEIRTGAAAIPQGSLIEITITWTCSGGPNTADFFD